MNQMQRVDQAPAPLALFQGRHLDMVSRACQAQGLDREEFELFCFTAERLGLDPMAKQICAVMRWDGKAGRKVMSIQTTIDGYRLIAARTGEHVGTSDARVLEGEDGLPISASVSVWRMIAGEPREFAATARWAEFAARTKDGSPTRFWKQMPRHMLSKVAESHALRKAFPAQLSGIYTDDEMAQAETIDITPVEAPAPRQAPAPKPEPKQEKKVTWLDSPPPSTGRPAFRQEPSEAQKAAGVSAPGWIPRGEQV